MKKGKIMNERMQGFSSNTSDPIEAQPNNLSPENTENYANNNGDALEDYPNEIKRIVENKMGASFKEMKPEEHEFIYNIIKQAETILESTVDPYEYEEEQNLKRYQIATYFHQYISQPARDNVPKLESETKVQDEKLADSLSNGANFGDRIPFANEHYSTTPDRKTNDIMRKSVKRKMEELFENMEPKERSFISKLITKSADLIDGAINPEDQYGYEDALRYHSYFVEPVQLAEEKSNQREKTGNRVE